MLNRGNSVEQAVNGAAYVWLAHVLDPPDSYCVHIVTAPIASTLCRSGHGLPQLASLASLK